MKRKAVATSKRCFRRSTLEATLKRDRNLYRVTAMRELTSLSTDLNLGQAWEPMKGAIRP